MPFTLSHPAIVLPLKKIPFKYRSMTGLIIGSMVPDFEYIIRLKIKSIYSHTLTGIFLFDLPFGLLLFVLYVMVVKNRLINHLPLFLYKKCSIFENHSNQKYPEVSVVVVIISILIGVCSHLVWDAFTHSNGYFVKHLPVLTNSIKWGDKTIYVYKIIQHSSTVLGAVAIAISIYLLPTNYSSGRAEKILKYWTIVFATAIILLLLRCYIMIPVILYGDLIVSAMAGVCLGLTIASLSCKDKLKI
jgi:hypothetical protein